MYSQELKKIAEEIKIKESFTKNDYVVKNEGINIILKNLRKYHNEENESTGHVLNNLITKMINKINKDVKKNIKSIQITF